MAQKISYDKYHQFLELSQKLINILEKVGMKSKITELCKVFMDIITEMENNLEE